MKRPIIQFKATLNCTIMMTIELLRRTTILVISFFLFGCKPVIDNNTNTLELKLIEIGQQYYKENVCEIKREESIIKAECENFNSKYYVFIEQCDDYKGYKLFNIDYWMEEESVSRIIDFDSFKICIKYLDGNKNIIANSGFDYKTDCCGSMFIGESEWCILYNDTTDKYIAVRQTGLPIDNIKQFNQLEWSDSVTTAIPVVTDI